MDINTVNAIRDFINATSLAILLLVIGVGLIGLFRPNALRFVFKEFASRKYIAVGGVFLGCLCGTIYTATQADYSSYNASQERPAAQSQTALPEDTTEDADEAETMGASTDSEAPQPAGKPAPQQSQPGQRTAPEQAHQDNGSPKNDAQQATNQSKSDKNCNGTQVLFVCL